MRTKILVVMGALFCIAAAVGVKQAGLPEAKVTIRVVDETKQPISGVNVRLGFQDRLDPRQLAKVEGLTDNAGLFTGQGGSDSVVGSTLRMQGYYNGSAPIPTFRDADEVSFRWLPWNPTCVAVMRKIGNPVPMHARRLRWLEIPAIGQPCGFDLAASDWVAPLGKGKVADFVMILSRRYENRDNFDVEVKLSFSNPGDGIQEVKLPEEWRCSNFIWPRMAPESGYVSSLSARFGGKPGSDYYSTATEKQAYFFRVRTVEQNGKIVSALYGKIKDGIGVEGRETVTGAIYFTYYLNPTSLDRNTEWDPQRNLLKGLSYEETPRDP
jgi:hypothetical protein